jgi:hypothetical protein
VTKPRCSDRGVRGQSFEDSLACESTPSGGWPIRHERKTMGTNYDWTAETDPCESCGHAPEAETLHVGKSSAGWCFALHVYPERNICDLDDWIRFIENSSGKIQDEYGRYVILADFLVIVMARVGRLEEERAAADPIYAQNHAEPGPLGLLRHRLERHCVKHGAGTWDCITGDFS